MKSAIKPLMFASFAIAILGPLTAYGDARWGEGAGFLLNGGVAFALMMLCGVFSVVVLIQQRLAKSRRHA